MNDSTGRPHGRSWLFAAVLGLLFVTLTLATWQYVSPSTSPLNYALTAEPWPAVPRPVRPVTLDPAQFTGAAAEGYRIAKERPELLERLPCYCGCYLSAGHQNSLDCFHDRHAAACEMCLQIAKRAEQLEKRGYGVADIRALVDREFAAKKVQ